MDNYVDGSPPFYSMTACREIMVKGSGSHHELPPQVFRAYIVHASSPILVTVVETGYTWVPDDSHTQAATAKVCDDEAAVWVEASRLRDEWYTALPEVQRKEMENEYTVPF